MTENETRNEVTILRAALEEILGDDLQLPDYYYDMIEAALATPSAAPEQTAKPRHYVNTIAAHNSEMCCRLGITMGHLRDDGSRELECILERLDRAQKQIAQQTVSEQTTDRGWLEAAIAWEVCASIHEKYAKGKDALYKTRHGDFVKHASDCRSAAHFTRPVAQQAAPEQKPVAWIDEFGNVFPLSAWKNHDRASHFDIYKKPWKPLFATPQQAAPEQPTSEYSQVAPSISQAVNEQAAFEAWAKREGISFQRTVTDACMDGRFPATYFIPATETAWRAWANKPVLQQAAPSQEPIAYTNGTYGGYIIIEPINRAMVLPDKMALYAAPFPQQAAPEQATPERSFYVIEKFTNGVGGEYWDGVHSDHWTRNIEDAMQYVRHVDCYRARFSCVAKFSPPIRIELAEHMMISALATKGQP